MKADIVLIKRTPDGIEDVIIIENKLSASTDFTVRQKEGWKKIANGENMTVKYRVSGFDSQGKEIILNDNNLTVGRTKVFKINDHGDADVSNVSITQIDVSKFQ